jgi:hypothetical protein
MEEHLLRLMAQIGLIGIVVWIVASAMGKREQALPARQGRPKHWARGDVWARSPVVSPYNQPSFQPQTVIGG